MEKLAILRWRGADEEPDTDSLLAAGDRLCRAGHWATAFVEHTGEAAGFRYGQGADGHVLGSALTVWVDAVEQAGEVVDQVPTAARTAAYLLTESVPLSWVGRAWPDGVRSPGVSLLTVFPKLPGIDSDAFFSRWHGSHSVLTFQIHPVRRYVRNAVVRSLGAGPSLDAVVTESFDVADLLDPRRFYGAGEPTLPWREALARMGEDLDTFCDMDRLQTAPTEEILLSSAPWER